MGWSSDRAWAEAVWYPTQGPKWQLLGEEPSQSDSCCEICCEWQLLQATASDSCCEKHHHTNKSDHGNPRPSQQQEWPWQPTTIATTTKKRCLVQWWRVLEKEIAGSGTIIKEKEPLWYRVPYSSLRVLLKLDWWRKEDGFSLLVRCDRPASIGWCKYKVMQKWGKANMR